MTTTSDTREALLRASKPPSRELFSTLITANHVLDCHKVVDAYGHISVRNPQNPKTFFLSRSLAPALVCKREDIEEYHVDDASALNKDASKGYAERFIHSEIYKKYADVQSVVHAHNEAVIPYSIGSVPLRPVFHMGGVMGSRVPIFDIQNHYRASDTLHSLLVTNTHLGAGLAAGFNPSSTLSTIGSSIKSYITSQQPQPVTFPPCPTVLMRGHGFTTIGTSIEEAVYRAVYVCSNARVQMQALMLQGTFNLGLVAERFGAKEGSHEAARQESIHYLSERECNDSWTQIQGTAERAWELWRAEVGVGGLYSNELLETTQSG